LHDSIGYYGECRKDNIERAKLIQTEAQALQDIGEPTVAPLIEQRVTKAFSQLSHVPESRTAVHPVMVLASPSQYTLWSREKRKYFD
jgi:hypothetical protein